MRRNKNSSGNIRRGFAAAVIICVLVLSSICLGYSGGSGTAVDPYQIADVNDLMALSGTPADYNKCFILTADIDLDPNLPLRAIYTRAVIAPDMNEVNGGYQGIFFSGVFDGNGHVINNLAIEGTSYCGLFGMCSTGAEVNNLGLENISINCDGDRVGGLIGYNSYGSLTGCYSTGQVSGSRYIGGLIGYNDEGSLTECYSIDTAVSGGDYVGGLIGTNAGDYYPPSSDGIANCYSVSNVVGNNYLGGLIGENKINTTNCYWTGTVNGTGTNIGGLMGTNSHVAIRNCHSNGQVSGYSRVGGLIGSDDVSSSVTNCYSITTVDGYQDVGGLLGSIGGTAASVSSSYSISSVTGTQNVGGLIGRSESPVYSCYSSGTVSGNFQTGGLIGEHSGYTLSYCYSESNVVGSDSSTGGLLGLCESAPVQFCYAAGTVNGVNYTGGLIGIIDNHLLPTDISNCYSTGSVNGTDAVGGLIGYAYDYDIDEIKIERCYSAGYVTGIHRVGGLIGVNYNKVTYCYWDIQTSGQTEGVGSGYSTGVTGRTTLQMKNKSNFISWDFVEIWDIVNGQTYPFLFGFGSTYGGGSGTAEDPYQIWTAEQMYTIGLNNYDWNKSFKLMTDIDMSDYTGTDYKPIGYYYYVPFSGSFDGDNHVIYNLTYSSTSTDGAGLFRCVDVGTEIKNLGLENVSFTGGNDVGGLVGVNSGDITNCYLTGTVSGASGVGGLCGYNSRGTIKNSYADGVVNGNIDTGGLIGGNDGIVSNCYAANAVNAEDGAGGFIGRHYGKVSNCFSTGPVSGTSCTGGFISYLPVRTHIITGCFWNTQTSGVTNAVGCYNYPYTIGGIQGRTTAQMQQKDNFLDAGWDFVGEVLNGTNDIWRMCVDEEEYPKLRWEFTTGDFVCPDGVDFFDFAVLANTWLLEAGEPGYNPVCDISNPADETVNVSDLEVFVKNWLEED